MLRNAVLAGMFCLACSATAADTHAPDSSGARMFDRMRGLVGAWEGTLEWSGGRSGSGKLRVNYHLTGGGSALVGSVGRRTSPVRCGRSRMRGACRSEVAGCLLVTWPQPW